MKLDIVILLYIVVTFVSGQRNDHQDPIPSDVYNQSKVCVVQDSHHQHEYYGYVPPCPDSEDNAPCVCTYDIDSEDNTMDLDCSAVESQEQVKQILKADFPFKNFGQFDLTYNYNNITVLESGVFNGVSFEIINIYYTDLEVVELKALNSWYETATKLNLFNNKITSFPFDELSQFSKLRYFSISGNSLGMVPADAFHGLTALEYLGVSDNYANFVGTFQDLPNLRDIDMFSNALTTVSANFIKTGSSYLMHIDLSGNNIVSVEPGAFDIVEGLEINMYGNSLSTLEEATWRPHLEAGGTLFAAYNPLICGCDIAWLFGEDQLLEQIGNYTTCNDGENLHDLDPSIFDPC
ncbi:unnamed protein product [Meganyctiphanes norvegica]|uniref:Oplophorus-luciferin 2-monooxygenase non-catalytic subunit n=1 Tax=Meganyctiphanes norvegica TaxID=48144 RepID=A0AAV2R6W6_MEGNR